MSELLQADVYVAPAIPVATGNDDPAKSVWSPISCTLIQGPHSAVLADTPISVDQTIALAEWIEKTAPGKKLTYIFITHAHTDHFGGAPVLLQRFPGVKLVATRRVAEAIRDGELSEQRRALWNRLFPNGQLSKDQIVPEFLPETSNEFTIDGHILKAINVEHSDTHATSFLYVPDIRLVVGGDIVYGECYQYLADANTSEKRQQWIDALDTIAALDPAIVVPGHKRSTQVDGPYLIESTKKYIRVFEEELKKAKNASELEEVMKKRYPTRWNEWILERSCIASFNT